MYRAKDSFSSESAPIMQLEYGIRAYPIPTMSNKWRITINANFELFILVFFLIL
jgi:hypothetical protein